MSSLYLKSALWDFVLVLAASLGMCYTLLNCFYVSPDLQYGPVPALVCAVVLLALFAGTSSKKAARVACPLIALLVVVSWVVGAALTPDGAFLADFEGNYLIFAMCTTLSAVGCFLATRSQTGCALLFVAGAFIVGLVQFLYERFELAWALVFIAAALGCIVYRNYRKSLAESASLRKVSFVPGFAVAAAVAAVAVGLGCGIWFGLIAPLNPPAAEVKLLTEYRALETLRVKGVADIYQVPNLDMTSDQTNDGERSTDDIKESPEGRPYPATGNPMEEEQTDAPDAGAGSNSEGINLNVPDDLFDFLTYEQKVLIGVLAALAVAGGIVAYFVGRRARRRRRLERIRALAPSQQVEAIYTFLMGRFARLGYRMAPGQTIADYAQANAATFEPFDAAAGVSFGDVTRDYAEAVYGTVALGQDAADRAGAYYSSFWRACRVKLGSVRYFLKSFRL